MSEEESKVLLKDARFVQLYRAEWEKLPIFQGWLAPVPGHRHRALCKYCKKEIRAHRTDLRGHARSQRHQNAKDFYIESLKHDAPSSVHLQNMAMTGSDKQNTSDDESLYVSNVKSGSIKDCAVLPKVVVQVANDKDDSIASKIMMQLTTGTTQVPPPNTHWKLLDKFMSSTLNRGSNSASATDQQSPISAQVLDLTRGIPVERLKVKLLVHCEDQWIQLIEEMTDAEGCCSKFLKQDELVAGRYRLHFDVKKYFTLGLLETAYPYVEVTFDVSGPGESFNISVLLSPFGYMVYRQT